ncbi:hypothetical protein [Chryseobacterium sp. P1-3]|uniref:hypothetical protein n=1 Tax=Chryseobacterium sp. (strain P1-3) TaxID=1517683 RepID=UPI000A406BE0|nr:hypothetical protein [Chryseobacterium sp. P1-3]
MENYLYFFLLFLLTSQSACGQLSEIKSDNPLQTELDIAVEKSVSGFIKKASYLRYFYWNLFAGEAISV